MGSLLIVLQDFGGNFAVSLLLTKFYNLVGISVWFLINFTSFKVVYVVHKRGKEKMNNEIREIKVIEMHEHHL